MGISRLNRWYRLSVPRAASNIRICCVMPNVFKAENPPVLSFSSLFVNVFLYLFNAEIYGLDCIKYRKLNKCHSWQKLQAFILQQYMFILVILFSFSWILEEIKNHFPFLNICVLSYFFCLKDSGNCNSEDILKTQSNWSIVKAFPKVFLLWLCHV